MKFIFVSMLIALTINFLTIYLLSVIIGYYCITRRTGCRSAAIIMAIIAVAIMDLVVLLEYQSATDGNFTANILSFLFFQLCMPLD